MKIVKDIWQLRGSLSVLVLSVVLLLAAILASCQVIGSPDTNIEEPPKNSELAQELGNEVCPAGVVHIPIKDTADYNGNADTFLIVPVDSNACLIPPQVCVQYASHYQGGMSCTKIDSKIGLELVR